MGWKGELTWLHPLWDQGKSRRSEPVQAWAIAWARAGLHTRVVKRKSFIQVIRCGYSDYQHLAKEYQIFTGCTTTEFYSIQTKAPERLFGDIEA